MLSRSCHKAVISLKARPHEPLAQTHAPIPRCVPFAAFEWVSLSISKREFTMPWNQQSAAAHPMKRLHTCWSLNCQRTQREHATVADPEKSDMAWQIIETEIVFVRAMLYALCSKSLYTHQTHNLHIHLYHIDFQLFLNSFYPVITPFTRYYEILLKTPLRLLIYERVPNQRLRD